MIRKRPLKPRLPNPPKTKVNRRILIRLIERYVRILGEELKYLKSLTGETVDLRVARDVALRASVAEESAESRPDGGGVTLKAMRQRAPGELESTCVYNAGPTGTDAELIETITPYTSALTEQTGTTP